MSDELSEESEGSDFSVSEDEWKPTKYKKHSKESSESSDGTDDDFVTTVAEKRKSKQSGRTSANHKIMSLSYRRELYNKYKTIKPTATFNKNASAAKKPEINKKKSVPQKKTNESDSDSSGDDYLVDPNKIDLGSKFFATQAKAILSNAKDSNVAMKLSDSEEELEDVQCGTSRITHAINKKIRKENSAKQIDFTRHENFVTNLENAKQHLKNFNSLTFAQEEIGVRELLALGETSHSNNNISKIQNQDKIDSDSEWDEVEENINPVIGNVEITVKSDVKKVGSTRQEYLETTLKRNINSYNKKLQLILHKVHVLCLIGYGNYLNAVINNPYLSKLCEQLNIPKKFRQKQTDLKYFSNICDWYLSVMELKSANCKLKALPPLATSLALQINSKEVICNKDFILIFIIMMRSLGIQCRLVINFFTTSLRPPSTALCSTKTKSELRRSGSNKENENKADNIQNITKKGGVKSTHSTKVKVDLKKISRKSSEKSQLHTKSVINSKENNIELTESNKYETSSISDDKPTKITSGTDENHKRHNLRTQRKNVESATVSKEKNIESVPSTQTLKTAKTPTIKLVIKKNTPKSPNKMDSPLFSKKKTNPNVLGTPIARRTRSKSKECIPEVATIQPQRILRKRKLDSKNVQISKINVPQMDGGDDDIDEIVSKKRKINVSKPSKVPTKFSLRLKNKNVKSNKTSTKIKSSDEDSDFEPSNGSKLSDTKTNQSLKSKNEKETLKTSNKLHTSDEDSDFLAPPKKKLSIYKKYVPKTSNTQRSRTRLLSTNVDDDNETKKNRSDMWIEVFCEKEAKWIPIDMLRCNVNKVDDIRKIASKPIAYVLAWNNNNTIRDVSARYCPQWNNTVNKLRVKSEWLATALKQYKDIDSKQNAAEDIELNKIDLKEPLPNVIYEYKNHPLYVLKRHLLKFEAIYPPDSLIMGYIRKEPVYSRDCVHILHSREKWFKQARVVKLGEQAYKVVRDRPHYNWTTRTFLPPQQLDIFGPWQTEPYDPPTAENGIVPRNAYGNVDLYKPEMLPKNTAHLQLPGLYRTCKKLKIDCAQAFIGWNFKLGMSASPFDGYVICEEFVEQVVEQWWKDQQEDERKEDEKYNQRVYGNWKKLIKGLLIRDRLQRKYKFAADVAVVDVKDLKKKKKQK